jgi:hypothetical protein
MSECRKPIVKQTLLDCDVKTPKNYRHWRASAAQAV